MPSPKLVLWCVDAQRDFLLPGGNLYVPGAEHLLPNIRRLTDVAREGRAFLVSHGCFHSAEDPEFKEFPPHCIRGTPGSEFVPEALTRDFQRVSNNPGSSLPEDIFSSPQIILEKQTLDIFESRHANALVKQFDQHCEFIVFGVVTEYCVRLAAKGLLERGKRVSLVEDAIETLSPEVGERSIAELKALGAKLVSTSDVLHQLNVTA